MDIGDIPGGSRARRDDVWRQALTDANDAARTGYDKAREIHARRRTHLQQTINDLERAIVEFARVAGHRSANQSDLPKQLRRLIRELHRDLDKQEDQLKRDLTRLEFVNVTLVGRTMAGKSTLREALTGGDGSTRGLGAQRTTRDVRSYTWRNLRVYDIPGIAAVDGETDERLAHDAARAADLILFLMTDTAPQPSEARHLAHVLAMGKPVIGLCNVQHAVATPKDLRRFRRVATARMDPKQLASIFEQFLNMTRSYQPNARVSFIPLHLEARFLGGRERDPALRRELLNLSNFAELEQAVTDEICRRGAPLRLRTFIDGAVEPALKSAMDLRTFARKNDKSAGLVAAKKTKLDTWRRQFAIDARREISDALGATFAALRERVPGFVEEHVESPDVGHCWHQEVTKLDLTGQMKRICQELRGEAISKLEELGRELTEEVSLSDRMDQLELDGASIFDARRFWGWSTTLLSGALLIGGLLLPPLAIVAGALSTAWALLRGKVQSREQKLERARRKLEQKLLSSIDRHQKESIHRVERWLAKELLGGPVQRVKGQLKALRDTLRTVAAAERSEARHLEMLAIHGHSVLLNDAFARLNITGPGEAKVARRPGVETLIWISGRRTLSKSERGKLERLLGERVRSYRASTPFLLLCQIFRPMGVVVSKPTAGHAVRLRITRKTRAFTARLELVRLLVDDPIEIVKGAAR